MKLWKCRHCGQDRPDEWKSCPECSHDYGATRPLSTIRSDTRMDGRRQG
jgi:uncharacterized membrane protein YvbJ